MNQTYLDVPALLKKYGIRPDKSLGQNFLIDHAALQRVVNAAEIQPEDSVLEIGPGLGSLTRMLAEAAREVVTVELDKKLLPPLEEVLAPYSNVRVVQGDILTLNPADLMPQPGYLVVANIPYYITSSLIRHLLEAKARPRRLVLTVQKEVAARINARPGDLSLLALSIQVYGHPSIAAHIPAGSFYPPPKVDSSIVRVDLLPEPRLPDGDLKSFFRLAKAGFSQKRKTLRNAVSASLAWPADKTAEMLVEAGIDPQRRAETVTMEEWGKLVEAFQKRAE